MWQELANNSLELNKIGNHLDLKIDVSQGIDLGCLVQPVNY